VDPYVFCPFWYIFTGENPAVLGVISAICTKSDAFLTSILFAAKRPAKMCVRPLHVLPISQFRRHTKKVLRRVSYDLEHIMLTSHGKGRACLIPMRDARVLWQLQNRPVKEMEDRLRTTYAQWLSAKTLDEAWEGMELDGKHWEDWEGFEKM